MTQITVDYYAVAKVEIDWRDQMYVVGVAATNVAELSPTGVHADVASTVRDFLSTWTVAGRDVATRAGDTADQLRLALEAVATNDADGERVFAQWLEDAL